MKIIDSTIIVALISMAGTIIGSMIGVMKSNDKTLYRIEQLEKKVEAHNNLVERMTIVEQEEKSMNNESKDWSVKNMINWKIRFKNPCVLYSANSFNNLIYFCLYGNNSL